MRRPEQDGEFVGECRTKTGQVLGVNALSDCRGALYVVTGRHVHVTRGGAEQRGRAAGDEGKLSTNSANKPVDKKASVNPLMEKL